MKALFIDNSFHLSKNKVYQFLIEINQKIKERKKLLIERWIHWFEIDTRNFAADKMNIFLLLSLFLLLPF